MMKKPTLLSNQKTWLAFVFFLLFQFGFTDTLLAQSGKVVSGTVLDQDGNVLVGAEVSVPQTTVKTKTNDKGNFVINLSPSQKSFMVTAKGKQAQYIELGDRTTVNVRMLPSSNNVSVEGVNGGKKKNGKTPKGERAVVGVVTDAGGQPIPSASVLIAGTQTGTLTDNDGKFFLTMLAGRDTLTISFVGFETQTVEVGNNESGVSVILRETTNNLNELVVVGYGAQKRSNITGAVSDVNFKDLENIPQSSIINMLSGRMAGVSIVQPGGEPGADQGSILVRGVGTLNDASPLVVIDGAVSSLTTFNNLSPTDIASVTVLKDASSAAIYGARGANGVILVTTKEPQKSRLRIDLNLNNSIQKGTYLPQFVNSWQWMTLHNEASESPTTSPTALPLFPLYAIENLKNGIVNDSFANSDWVGETYRTGMFRSANMSVNGGNNNASFQGSFGVVDQEGIMKGFSSRRYNYRSNIRLKASETVDVGLNLFGYLQSNNAPFVNASGILTRINQAYPIMPVRYANGDWGVNYPGARPGTSTQAPFFANNAVLATEIGYNDRKTLNNNMLAFMTYRPFQGFILSGSFNYSTDNAITEAFNPTYDYRGINPAQTGLQNLKNTLINRNANSRQYQAQLTANYNKVIKAKHGLGLLAGYEYTDFEDRFFEAEGRDLPSNDNQVLSNALSDLRVAGDKNAWRVQSAFGRMNYSFDNKYLLEGNIRIDGSSRFPANERYGIFPSFSAGWLVSNESFFRPLSKVVSLLKFRGGWGKVGNDRIGNYPYQQVYSTRSFYPLGDVLNVGVAQNRFSNPDIRWEETAVTNLGMDAAFMENRLFLNLDVYNKITNGILYQLALPASFGVVTPANLNAATVSNKGIDINLEYKTQIAKKVFFNLGINFSYVKNNVDKLQSREAVTGQYILREGHPINTFYVMQNLGIYKDTSEFDKYPVFNNDPFTRRIGSMYFEDTNKDGLSNLDDRVAKYSSITPYTFGSTLGVSFKGFDLNVLVQGVKDKYIYIADSGNRPGNTANTQFWKEWWDNRYDAKDNPNGTWTVLKRQAPETNSTTFYLRDASYIRIKNIEFGYTLSSKMMKKMGMRNFRIYLTGNNLFTFSNLIKQIDPERANGITGNTQHPQLKTMSVGLNVGF